MPLLLPLQSQETIIRSLQQRHESERAAREKAQYALTERLQVCVCGGGGIVIITITWAQVYHQYGCMWACMSMACSWGVYGEGSHLQSACRTGSVQGGPCGTCTSWEQGGPGRSTLLL